MHPYPLWLLSLFVCAGQEVAWRDAAEAPPLEGSRYLGPQHRFWPQTSVPLRWCHPEGAAGALLLPPGVRSGPLPRRQRAKVVFIFPSYPELPLHQVSARDHLRHRMFNLQPRVHLHEVEVVLAIHDELHRTCSETRPGGTARCGPRLCGDVFAMQRLTCSDIVDSLGCSDCCFSKFPPNFSADSRLKAEKINCLKTLLQTQTTTTHFYSGYQRWHKNTLPLVKPSGL